MSSKRTSTLESPIEVDTLGIHISLPEGTTVSPYECKNKSKPSKQSLQRQKYSQFSYYKLSDGSIVKILFLDADTYIEVSRFPFVKETLQVKNFKELNDKTQKRLVTCNTLLVGLEDKKQFLLKKLEGCKVSQQDGEIDTLQDVFQCLPISNQQRYYQVLESLKDYKKPMSSLRIIVQEDGDKAKLLDFECFFTERQYLQRFKPGQQLPKKVDKVEKVDKTEKIDKTEKAPAAQKVK